MRKFLFLIPVLFLVLNTVNAQGSAQDSIGSVTQGTVAQLDAAVKRLAGDAGRKLLELRAQKIVIGQFVYRGSMPPLCDYWINQLTGELTNIPGRSFTLVSGGPAGADWTISGEIIEAVETIRVYTRLIRTDNRAIEAVFYSDIERNEQINSMLFSADNRGGRVAISMDEWEPDSTDSPVPYEAGNDESVSVVDRTIHDRNDQDFFLFIMNSDGRLVMETTGDDIDTYMELFNADTGEKLAENDDGGSNTNARIRHDVQAGRRYIAKVRGYDSDEIGRYGFRAYLVIPVRLAPDEYEPDDGPDSAKLISVGTPQQHTFHNGDDVDWVKFQIERSGRYIIRASGVTSNQIDTVIELFDADMNPIDDNDDGGEDLDARLSIYLGSGLYYLKIYCYDSEPEEPYSVSITAQ